MPGFDNFRRLFTHRQLDGYNSMYLEVPIWITQKLGSRIFLVTGRNVVSRHAVRSNSCATERRDPSLSPRTRMTSEE